LSAILLLLLLRHTRLRQALTMAFNKEKRKHTKVHKIYRIIIIINNNNYDNVYGAVIMT